MSLLPPARKLGGLKTPPPSLLIDRGMQPRLPPDPKLQELLLGRHKSAASEPHLPAPLSKLKEVKPRKEIEGRPLSPFSQMISQKSQCNNLSLVDQKVLQGAGNLSPSTALMNRDIPFPLNDLRKRARRDVSSVAQLPEIERGGALSHLGRRNIPNGLPSLSSDRTGAKSSLLPPKKRPAPSDEAPRSTLQAPRNSAASSPQRGSQTSIEQLVSAAKHGRFDDVRDKLEAGFDVNAQDSKGNTLLIVACQNNLKKLAKICLQHGADPLIKNNKEHDSLYYCKTLRHDSVHNLIIAEAKNLDAEQVEVDKKLAID